MLRIILLPLVSCALLASGEQQVLGAVRHTDARGIFIDHFSAARSGTSAYLYSRLAQRFKDKEMVVTQERYFDPVAYSKAEPELHVKVKPDSAIKLVHFLAAARRRDGVGTLTDDVQFAEYELRFGDESFTAIKAVWKEGYELDTQWHLFGDAATARTLIHACASYLSATRNAILVFSEGFWHPDENLWQHVQGASWDDVILDSKLKKAIQHDYRSFYSAEDVYKKYRVPWKRGLIFLGPPGNGKSVSIAAIQRELSSNASPAGSPLPILYVKSFHTFAGDERGIREIFQRARHETPCLLVLEDLDSLITDENRSFFLNEVDGLEDNDGLLLIGTTNHFDRLDPALSNRPSRFDRKYEFPAPSRDERRQYALYWQKKLSDNRDIDFPDSLADEVADRTDSVQWSFAYLKEAFVSTLLIIAGKASDQTFRSILFDQIDFLRDQLAKGEGPATFTFGGGGGAGWVPPRVHRASGPFAQKAMARCAARTNVGLVG